MSAIEPTKKFFWFIVYVIWMVLDVEGVWERSHLVAVLAGAFGTCALAFAEYDKRSGFGGLSVLIIPIAGGFY